MAFITDLTAVIPSTGGYTNGQPSGIVNNGGTINNGGIATGLVYSVITPGVIGGGGTPITWVPQMSGDRVITYIASGAGGTTGINPSGPWNHNNNTGVMPLVTRSIATVEFSGLNGGGSNSSDVLVRECAHWTASPLYKSAVLSGWWSEYRGQFSFMTDDFLTTPSGGLWNISSATILSSCTGQNTDSQSTPGGIVFGNGGIPTTTGYGPRYNW